VYAGANDGFLHAFRAGSFDGNGVFCNSTSLPTSSSTNCAPLTPNDGREVLAYMPGSVLNSAALSSTAGGCNVTTSTGTVVQNIHGWTPAIGGATQCETPELDISATQYGHNFFVDATPGTGDLFYNNTWHTWLVGGLGAGGAAIYALNVTDPSSTSFAEGNASNIVVGEWNASSITCTGTSNCGSNLGNTFGTPQIRRLHNGNWGVIFGNGFGSASGDGGIYIMSIDISSGAQTFYYLSTGSGTVFSGTGSQAAGVVTISAVASGAIAVGNVLNGPGVAPGSTVISFGTGTGGTGTYNVSTSGTVSSGAVTVGNGIAYTTPADLDGDHITDYVYAGDLKGNLWRFDLTAADPSLWGVTNANGVSINASATASTATGLGAGANGNGGGSAAPLFKTKSGQPIATQVLVISNTVTGGAPRLLVEFGTGQRTQITNAGAASYVQGTQSMYGVWDWHLSAWNAVSGSQYNSLTTSPTNTTGLTSPFTLAYSNLQSQTLAITAATLGTANQVVDETTTNPVCWQGGTACSSNNNKFGWYADLPSTQEQVIFNPVFFQGAFLVNTTVPATNVPTACTNNQDTGFTYALNISSGGAFSSAFPTFKDPKTGVLLSDSTSAAVQTNATGSVYVVQTVQGKPNIVYQTVSGTPGAQQVNIPSNTKAKRLTWIELR
jgi:type IV pilus assembly protein PilY1